MAISRYGISPHLPVLAGQFTPTVAQIEAQPLGSKMRRDVRVLATAGDLLFAGYANKVVGVWKIGSQAGTAQLVSAVPSAVRSLALVPLEGGTRWPSRTWAKTRKWWRLIPSRMEQIHGDKKAFTVAQKELDSGAAPSTASPSVLTARPS